MTHQLTIRPLGGLCNRIRTIVSARRVAGWQKRDLTVLWRVNEELGARFEDLFEPVADMTVINIPEHGLAGLPLRIRHSYAGIPAGAVKRLGVRLLRRLFFERTLEADECRRRVESNRGFGDVRDTRRLLLIGYDWICNGPFDFSFLKPQASIRARIESVTSRYEGRTIGVHIRRTDHDRSIQNSPLALFITHMEEELRQHAGTRFYVATDDPGTDRELKARFGSAIIPVERVYGRSDLGGIQSAMVDLYCLSRTLRILGSHQSSFSETACRLGNSNLTVVETPARPTP